MPIKSIRLYLIAVLVSTICLVNFAAALNGYQNSTRAGQHLLDKQLIDRTQALQRLIENGVVLTQKALGDDVVFQVWGGASLLQHSEGLTATVLLPVPSQFQMLSFQGYRWRIYTHFNESTGLSVVYGERHDIYNKLIDTMVLEFIFPIIWVLPIIALLIWLIVGYGLRPVKVFARILKQRGANELSPIEEERFPDELTPLVDSTNKLFARLAHAFEREQRFAADAAHELRTPLAALKINLHNHAKEHKLSGASFEELKASALRMEHSIEQLLTLYRLSPESFQGTIQECQLKSLAQDAVIAFYDSMQSKGQQIELMADDVVIQGDHFALSILLKNLIDNASKYTPDDGEVRLQISSAGDSEATIIVEDSGPGIPDKDFERVFDRFYRVGGDQHPSGVSGTGLGLSIVNHIVELHAGSIQLARSGTLGGLSVTITLPLTQIKKEGVEQ